MYLSCSPRAGVLPIGPPTSAISERPESWQLSSSSSCFSFPRQSYLLDRYVRTATTIAPFVRICIPRRIFPLHLLLQLLMLMKITPTPAHDQGRVNILPMSTHPRRPWHPPPHTRRVGQGWMRVGRDHFRQRRRWRWMLGFALSLMNHTLDLHLPQRNEEGWVQ